MRHVARAGGGHLPWTGEYLHCGTPSPILTWLMGYLPRIGEGGYLHWGTPPHLDLTEGRGYLPWSIPSRRSDLAGSRDTYLGWGCLPWTGGVPTLGYPILTWPGVWGTYLGREVTYLWVPLPLPSWPGRMGGGTYLGRWGTYLGGNNQDPNPNRQN